MAAMMIVMVVLMVFGPHHGFTGQHDASRPNSEATYVQIDTAPADKTASQIAE